MEISSVIFEKKKHENNYLQNAWNKYKEASFVFEIIEICNKKSLIKKEKHYIKFLNTLRPNGYNLSKGGLGNTGWIPSSETIIKNSLSVSGNKNPMWGRRHSKETKKLFSEQRKGSQNGIGNKNNLGLVKKYKNSTSKYYGVFKRSYMKKNKTETIAWRARINFNGEEIKLGTFSKEIDAAKAFDKKSWELYKDLSKLNFPENYI